MCSDNYAYTRMVEGSRYRIYFAPRFGCRCALPSWLLGRLMSDEAAFCRLTHSFFAPASPTPTAVPAADQDMPF